MTQRSQSKVVKVDDPVKVRKLLFNYSNSYVTQHLFNANLTIFIAIPVYHLYIYLLGPSGRFGPGYTYLSHTLISVVLSFYVFGEYARHAYTPSMNLSSYIFINGLTKQSHSDFSTNVLRRCITYYFWQWKLLKAVIMKRWNNDSN